MGYVVSIATVVLLAAHLLAMSVPSAAPLVCIWLHRRGGRGDAAAHAVGRKLARLSLASLLVGAALGVLLGAAMWAAEDRAYWDAVARFPMQAYGFALGELGFTAICLAVYTATWDRSRNRPRLHAVLAVLATTNLVYHFPPLMIALGDLAARPELIQTEVVTRPVFRELLLQPELQAKVLHFVLASVMVAGVMLMLVARHQPALVEHDDGTQRLVSRGAWIALIASFCQLVVGAWVLVQLPAGAQAALLGVDWLATLLFVLSLLAVFYLLHSLASAALGSTSPASIRRTAALMLSVVLLMSAVLTRVRYIETSIHQFAMLRDTTASQPASFVRSSARKQP